MNGHRSAAHRIVRRSAQLALALPLTPTLARVLTLPLTPTLALARTLTPTLARVLTLTLTLIPTLALALALLLGAGTARADGGDAPSGPERARIHLRGSARLDAHAARAAGRLLLSGTVVDDVARPLPSARVALVVSNDRGEPVLLASATPAACSDGAAPPTTERPDTLVLTADEAGRFCVRLSLPIQRYVARLESRAEGLVDASKLEVPVDLALAPVTLRFDPEPTSLALDDEGVTFEVVASTEDDGVTIAAAGLPLVLTNEAGVTLGAAATNGSGRCRFGVDPARLGPPGRGELRVAFAGNGEAGAASRTAAIERRTWVELLAPDANDAAGHRLPAGSPEDGMALRIVARPGCARLGCTALPGGAIEVRAASTGSAIVGAAALDHGEAHVVATFAMPAAEVETLQVRYVPDAPWFRPRGELTLVAPLRSPSPLRKAPLVLAGLGVLAWLVLARLSPRAGSRSNVAAANRPSRPPTPRASVELVQAGAADQGWRGRLRDAHDGRPLGGARVAIERRGFERVETVAQAWSDADGAFVLPTLAALPGDAIVAEGPEHALLRGALPPPGILDVALVLRKRALLDHLVRWARGRGAPFDARPEATPGHVRRAAGSEFTVARWADAVERAAYGGQPVDASAQAEVDRLAPAEPEARQDSPEHVDAARRRSL